VSWMSVSVMHTELEEVEQVRTAMVVI
jgi:hypothetical protein